MLATWRRCVVVVAGICGDCCCGRGQPARLPQRCARPTLPPASCNIQALPRPAAPARAQAHLQAADALLERGLDSPVAGKPYFITNDDPRPFWGFLGDLCQGLGYGRPRVK